MNVNDFENYYKDAMAEALNELQSAVLLLEQVQRKIHIIGSSVQNLNENMEEFINKQKAQ
ncbi:conserved hypothetical protein [Trichormus variabilis ATCC 29413]|uniref:Uncharacterized protein n=2 Tax=Anabaena variabilis TaxID=264691 RepID=Q3M543_TRIV2|nr:MULTISPECIES: hypothetical protein [Nostocaceae]ABA23893.1 conserved hypothetical protein [Trichormus variabilis ATCC 29413]MBC1217513.1 hypothetical protein [Trichormus variabilis ARAD]MBC1258768.1 hypothetical protein [Trichormus variabilis V5]MBC1266857.1 hypothetical protein [Trichormus variabilis FSR]MBC1300465.1 hypothetical protein [Trichormus variabilis N2B]